MRARVAVLLPAHLRLDGGGLGVLKERKRSDPNAAVTGPVAELARSAETHELLAKILDAHPHAVVADDDLPAQFNVREVQVDTRRFGVKGVQHRLSHRFWEAVVGLPRQLREKSSSCHVLERNRAAEGGGFDSLDLSQHAIGTSRH